MTIHTKIYTDVPEVELDPSYAGSVTGPASTRYSVWTEPSSGSVTIVAPYPFGVSIAREGPFDSTLELSFESDITTRSTIFVHFLDDAKAASYKHLSIENRTSEGAMVAVLVSGIVRKRSSSRDGLRARVRGFSGISREVEAAYTDYVRPYVSGFLVDEEINFLLTTTIEKIREDFSALTKDPAARERLREAGLDDISEEEAISFLHRVYPSMQAVLWYRVGNEIYYTELIEDEALRHQIALEQLFPEGRKRTGVDIDPRTRIGRRFVIDHGAGTVIGRHTQIGDDCYILHAVNLGAVPGRSAGTAVDPSEGRHPIIGNRVTIFGYASILGGIRVGDDCQIGTRCLITESIPDNSKVRIVNQYQIVRQPISDGRPKPELFGIVPREQGKFELHGRDLSQLSELHIVDELDTETLPFTVHITTVDATIAVAQIKSPEHALADVRRYSKREVMRDRLILARLKMRFADPNGTVIYLCQAAGLRTAIEEALRWEGLWHD